MLTRLKVSGFKNLVDVDVQFGPFTCIAGVNGVGKSNLFDAIRFLSALADYPLMEAASMVRDEENRTSDVRNLFHRVGNAYDDQMSFEAEMIIPESGVDDLGQPAKAAATFLRYSLSLAYRKDEPFQLRGSLEILKEELVHIPSHHLLFEHQTAWANSVIQHGKDEYFISTERDENNRVTINQYNEGSDQVIKRVAETLPRTVLSVAHAAESPTTLLVRREMQSWRLLQLEPSALRKPDAFSAPAHLSSNGAHLTATLYRLAVGEKNHHNGTASHIYGQIANRLAELIDDVYEVGVDRDDRHELLTLQVVGNDGTPHAARSLSDGTLRFLALAVLELDPEAQGLICLEEPENGIHPKRIPAMLRLLQDIATDTDEPIGEDNPLRQVIINTHSPAVVQQVPEDSLLVAEARETVKDGRRFNRVVFSALQATWRERFDGITPVSKGDLLAYLNPVQSAETAFDDENQAKTPKRVVDRRDLQLMLPMFGESE